MHSILAGIMLAMFLSALEQTIVAPALPAIGKSLADVDDLSWVVTAYLLAATAATPLFGKLSDIHGRRTIILLAIGIFIFGSLACAVAPSLWLLVVGRGLQGFGGGGLIPLAQTIIADLLSPRERPMAQSYTSVMFMIASILGPVLGGVLTDHLHWSFIFWINLPLGGIAMVMTARALRSLPRHERPHRLDVLGMSLMVGAAIAMLLALDWGGTHYPWTAWQIIALLAFSIALWILFAGRLLTAREPLIPLSILRGRVTSAITCAASFSIGTIIGITIYTPVFCQLALGASASVSGVALIGFMLGATLGSLLTGRLITRVTHYMRLPMVGLAVAIGTLVVLAICSPTLVFLVVHFAACGARSRARADVSDQHHRHAKRSQAASIGNGDGCAEFLSASWWGDHRCRVRCDRAGQLGRAGWFCESWQISAPAMPNLPLRFALCSWLLLSSSP